MHDAQLGRDRDEDRRLRAQIDPLIDGLSPLGKFELATRLIGESIVDTSRTVFRRELEIVDERRSIPVIRVIEAAKEEGEREEAPGRSGSPGTDSSDADGVVPTTR